MQRLQRETKREGEHEKEAANKFWKQIKKIQNMKKIILGGIAAVVIAVLAAVNVKLNSQSENLLSDLALANVEALASGETSGGGGAYLTCYCSLMSDQNCAVNNNGSSVCAGGENIRCWEYNRNCN
jgi:hypothetical protein